MLCHLEKFRLLQSAAWETARLRVHATSMAAENDALKNHVAQLMHQISNMDRSVQVQPHFYLAPPFHRAVIAIFA